MKGISRKLDKLEKELNQQHSSADERQQIKESAERIERILFNNEDLPPLEWPRKPRDRELSERFKEAERLLFEDIEPKKEEE